MSRGSGSGSRLRAGRLVWIVAGLAFLAPALAVLPLRWVSVDSSAFMRQAEARGVTVRQDWISAERLSPWLGIAVVAAEDQTFPLHHGFDVESIRAALDAGASRGASTLSQQLVKNLYLWPDRSWLRKALEAWLTLYLEALVPKARILEVYLNVAEFGPGLYGAEAAARALYGKSASDLTLDECARLAAVLPNPNAMSAARPSAYVLERAAWIEDQVRRLGGPGYLRPDRDRPGP
jgi:monofunctional biosynthetic peptidoglycan transglycosylase